MDHETERLNLLCDTMQAKIDKHNRLLFNAFTLTKPEILQREPPYDWEFLASVTSAFYKYMDELDAMGRHDLYTG